MKKRLSSGLLAAFFLLGCAHADITRPGYCELYGVKDTGAARQIRSAQALPQAQIDEKCKRVLAPVGYVVTGCAIVNEDDTIDLFWRAGDKCVEMHERAHAQCGMTHTERFNYEVRLGHPRPSCPSIG